MSERPDYFDRYATMAFERSEDGILTLRLHSDGKSVEYGAQHHTDWSQAFLDVSTDRDNKVVILTGTGDAFIDQAGWGEPVKGPEQWDRVHWEARRVLTGLLEIEAPVIGAINGPATIHAELALLSDITLAADHAVFQDAMHIGWNAVPGGGVQVIWPELLGPNRGRYFLLTGQTLSAEEAMALGVVNEVLPREELMPRAMEHARKLVARPELTRRYTRLMFARRWKRLLDDSVGYGLALEGLDLLRSS